MRAAIAAAGLMLALHGAAAHACGHCVEDKIAVVYDHALIMQALARQQQIAFFAIEGNFPANELNRKMIEASAGAIDGVEKNSVRVSVEQAALALVFDPKRHSLAAIQKALEKKLADKKMRLLLLKVMDRPSTR